MGSFIWRCRKLKIQSPSGNFYYEKIPKFNYPVKKSYYDLPSYKLHPIADKAHRFSLFNASFGVKVIIRSPN